MHKSLIELATAFEGLAKATLDGYAADTTLMETWGWNCPALTRHDMASIPANLAARLRESDANDVDKEILKLVPEILRKINLLQTNTLVYLYNGNATSAAHVYIDTLNTFKSQLDSVLSYPSLESLRVKLEPMLTWESVDNKSMPAPTARRLRLLNSQIDDISSSKEQLTSHIEAIQNAYDAAQSLPTDLEELKEAHIRLTKISTDAAILLEKIDQNQISATQALTEINEKGEEATDLINKCEDAYQITTTKGLAGAFDQRALSLSRSMIFWVLGLIIALCAGSYVGSHSFGLIMTALISSTPKWDVVLLNIIISIFSIGAPVWFSWIATKQIGQRFRLSEDYAFKASTAKAYEGYRKEAARLDPDFEARLFDSALSRLEEAPLRLVESDTHGSPWHELFASQSFKNALDKVPNLREVLQQAISKKSSPNPVKASTEEAPT